MKLVSNQPTYRRSDPTDIWTPVLVAVINSLADYRRVLEEQWYRIPVKRAPRQIAAEYLALYQTGKFGASGKRINFYAPILRYHLLTRAELLPDQPDHPRAHEQYFKLELGDLIQLEQPITNSKHPRLTFVYTTLERLLEAKDVGDLWLRAAARQRLYQAIYERGLAVECWYPVNMGIRPEADLALLGPQGRLTLYIDEPSWEDLDEAAPAFSEEETVHVDARTLLQNPEAVLDDILADR